MIILFKFIFFDHIGTGTDIKKYVNTEHNQVSRALYLASYVLVYIDVPIRNRLAKCSDSRHPVLVTH